MFFFFEYILVAVLIVATYFLRSFPSRWFQAAEQYLSRLARRRALAVLVVAFWHWRSGPPCCPTCRFLCRDFMMISATCWQRIPSRTDASRIQLTRCGFTLRASTSIRNPPTCRCTMPPRAWSWLWAKSLRETLGLAYGSARSPCARRSVGCCKGGCRRVGLCWAGFWPSCGLPASPTG